MFEHLSAVPPDPILGLISAYTKDPNPRKIDLGIGVYRDESGATPILQSVLKAEKVLLETQTTKTYLGPPGVVGFNQAMTDLMFGPHSDTVAQKRVCTIQTPGGTAGLSVGAQLIKATRPESGIWASDPTWANHLAIYPGAGLEMYSYPYYDSDKKNLLFVEMMSALNRRGPGDIVLFHACCHNPCGVSPNPEQWETIASLAAERGFTPLVDIAYMGFERGIEEDSLAVRLFADKCPEMIVASSCSKNFALYRERVGALSVVCENEQKANDVATVINSLTRRSYSMPPAHGPAVVDIILHSEELTALWRHEVTGMRKRINELRKTLAEKIKASGINEDFSFLAKQSGMFSFLGLSVEQVQRLKQEYAIYTVNSARVNIASFNDDNLDYFVDALTQVL